MSLEGEFGTSGQGLGAPCTPLGNVLNKLTILQKDHLCMGTGRTVPTVQSGSSRTRSNVITRHYGII